MYVGMYEFIAIVCVCVWYMILCVCWGGLVVFFCDFVICVVVYMNVMCGDVCVFDIGG